MSSGRTHAAVTMVASTGAAYLLYRQGWPSGQAIAFCIGGLAGLLVNPDLDVDNGSISQRVVRKSTGCLPGLIWSTLWYPYAILIPHRSPLSHWPILGTILRLVYLVLIFHLVLFGLHFTIGLAPITTHTGALSLPVWALPAFLGLALSDALHYLFDYLPRFR